MNICIVGAGHVGLVTGGCFADLGNRVIVVDIDKEKLKNLKNGVMPFYEPGMEELIHRGMKEKRLYFTTSLREGVMSSIVIFIAVGTPPKDDGDVDLTFVENVARQIAEYIPSYRLIVEKSTVPVETGKWVKHTLSVYNKRKLKFDVASNPEFLREGQAISDFMQPDRIVLGVETKRAKDILMELYKPLNVPVVVTDIKSAELIKHASNSFLATKISFINTISQICQKVGADVSMVAKGMGLDRRIGRHFLEAGIGYGGFCFPKDLDAFIRISEKLGIDFKLLKAVKKINEEQKHLIVKMCEDSLWLINNKEIGVLGLSFKPNTDDMRFAPSIDIINMLQEQGARIRAFDPQAMHNASRIFKGVKFCKDPYEVAKDADCLTILTEWNEFKELDFNRIKKLMRQPVIIDGRNIYEPRTMKKLGFRYTGIGRG